MWGLRQLSRQLPSLSLGRLQWIAIVTPGLLVIVWEFLSHFYIHRVLVSDVYLFMVTAVALALGAVVFTLALFAIIERMQQELVARNRQVAVLEERDRIAMETHDGLAQVLGGITARLKAIGELARLGRFEELEEHTRQTEQVVQGAYADVREYILGLKTPVARGLEFMDALRQFLHSFSQQHRLPVELIANREALQLPPPTEVQLIRIIQEALSNVRRHSGTDRAWVRFDKGEGSVTVTIKDNGRGFDPSSVETMPVGHLGLQAMRQRAESVGASLEVLSRPGEGTRVVVVLSTNSQGREGR